MSTILITGGSGLIGKALTQKLLQKNHQVIIVSRDKSILNREWSKNVTLANWNVKEQTIEESAIRKADCIVHLAGANVAEKRWTEKRKKEIFDSRIKSSDLLIKALREIPNSVKAVVSASAIGWYGPDSSIPPTRYFTEDDGPHLDFLGQTCRRWEESLEPLLSLNKRLVKIRTGIVLDKSGGALKEFLMPLRFCIAAIIGTGEQMVSWIHLEDLCRIYIEAIENENMDGAFNGVAPIPVNNKTLTLELARISKGNLFIPIHVPAFILKMVLGEMSIEVLKSCSVSAGKIKGTGFQFLYPTLESALKELIKP